MLAVGLGGALGAATSGQQSAIRGLFVTETEVDAARSAIRREERERFLVHLEALVTREPDPFMIDDPLSLRFGWDAPEARDALTGAVAMLKRDMAAARDLALGFTLTRHASHAKAAWRYLDRWAAYHTPVNFYDYDPDFDAGTHRGQTEGWGSFRPWNFGLDAIWQCYGLINAADAVVLLRDAPRSAGQTEVMGWLRNLTAAVDSGFHAWTRWADAHPDAGRSYERYRTDNHLSWAQVGLLASAVAQGNATLIDYVMRGDIWDNGRSGPYANPSPLPTVITEAIEMVPDTNRGRIFEERIVRSPLIGYALFHLEAMSLAARIAAVHDIDDLWHDTATGTRLLAAFRRYAPYLKGQKKSPDPAERRRPGRWLFALSPDDFAKEDRASLLQATPLGTHYSHVLGPARLLFTASA